MWRLFAIGLLTGAILSTVEPAKSQAAEEFDSAGPMITFRLGSFDATTEATMGRERAPDFADQVVFAFGGRFNRFISLEFDLSLITRKFAVAPRPGLVSAGDELQLRLTGRSIVAKIYLPFGAIEPYVGGGAGNYEADLAVEATLAGIEGEVDLGSSRFSGQLRVVGLQYLPETKGSKNRMALGVEWRQLDIGASVTASPQFANAYPGEIPLDGAFVSVGFTFFFGAE